MLSLLVVVGCSSGALPKVGGLEASGGGQNRNDASREAPVSEDSLPDAPEADATDSSGNGDGGSGEAHDAGQTNAGAISAADIVFGSDGAPIIIGTLKGTVDLGRGPLVSAGAGDLLLAGLGAAGTIAWNARFGDAEMQGDGALAVDKGGNLYLATTFKGTLDLGGGPLTSAGGQDVAVAKLDRRLGHVWSRRFGRTWDQEMRGMAVDSAGRVVVGATSITPFDLGGGTPDAGGSTQPTSTLAALDPESGAVIWSKAWPVVLRAIAVDATDRIIAVGSFSETIDFGGGALTNAGHVDFFVLVLSRSGDHVFSKRFGGTGADQVLAVTLDPTGNLLITGFFEDSLDLGGPQPLVSVLSTKRFHTSSDMFVAKLDGASGAHIWSRRFGDAEEDQAGFGIASDAAGGAVVVGGFAGTIDFGSGPLSTAGGRDFIVRLSPSGVPIWHRQLTAEASAVRVNPMSGSVIVAGAFPASASFPGASATTRTGSNVFLVEYPP